MVARLSGSSHLSLFHYMALAPAQHPDLATIVITLSVAIVLGVIATMLFDRRDLQSA